MLTEKYNHKEREKKWQEYWAGNNSAKEKIYAWKNDLPREKTFVIDTPPPTVSGVLHMGHVFSYTQADFVARFWRMCGHDVFYPMGFDDNGLPTERLVEKIIGKKAGFYEKENGAGSFVSKCREVVEEAEKEFEAMFNSIALSVDWSQKYQTISPESQKISQSSFVDLYKKGLVKREFEPVFWDISDRTALAQADLIDKEVEGEMNYILFEVEEKSSLAPLEKSSLAPFAQIEIMTTRPELLPACVAVMVNPEDARYKHLHGKFAITPLFGVRVPIIADEDVLIDKGTGAVMCCTFGDETDIKWWKRHKLPTRVIISRSGLFNRVALDYIDNSNSVVFIDDFAIQEVADRGFSRKKVYPILRKSLDINDCNPNQFISVYNLLFSKKIEIKDNFFENTSFRTEYLKIKEAKEAIIEALKNPTKNHQTLNNASPNHSPLEGESKSLSDFGGGSSSKKNSNSQRLYSQETLENAKELRQNQTNAEGLLWYYLSNKKLAGHKFRRQQPIGEYIADFVCLESKLIIELDGSQHNEAKAIQYDQKRTEFFEKSGFKVLRFWNNEFFQNVFGVLDKILDTLNNPAPNAAHSTLPQGEGEKTPNQKPLLVKQEKITRAVKCAERSGTPIEILVMPQWFVKILDKKEELKQKAKACNWYPQYMQVRVEQWIDGLAWDWCISRQRFFGVKFPIWYSKRKGEEGKILVANFGQLPVDPAIDLPIDPENKNGTGFYLREEVDAETDILDTWATSSVSPQLSSGMVFGKERLDELLANNEISPEIYDEYQRKLPRHEKLFPADMRPQAHEIIRTWAFYTIVKAHLHENKIPWRNLMISGWCLAADKSKMSKSKGNVVTPTALIEEKGSDIVRYWTSTSHLGADTAYSEDVFKIGQKLVTKLFNAAKFVAINFNEIDLQIAAEPINTHIANKTIFETADLWILSKLHETLAQATVSFEKFEYAKAREKIEEFFWHYFCDNYLEIIKVRSYGVKAEKLSGLELNQAQKDEITKKQLSAIYTLYACLNTLLKLFAPFIPHICEEIYQAIFTLEAKEKISIHARGNWPKIENFIFDENAQKLGDTALAVLFEVRKFKSDNNLSMKTTIANLQVQNPLDLTPILPDLENVCNAAKLEFAKAHDAKVIITPQM